MGCLCVFFQSGELSCSRNGNDPGLFAEHPRQGNLCRSGLFFFRQIMEQEEEILVGVKAFRSELRHGAEGGEVKGG